MLANSGGGGRRWEKEGDGGRRWEEKRGEMREEWRWLREEGKRILSLLLVLF
jgi:hypothetical protein